MTDRTPESIQYTPTDGPLAGRKLHGGKPAVVQGVEVVRFWPVKVDRKERTPCIKIDGRPDLAELVARYRAEEAEIERKKAEYESRKAAMLVGLDELRAAYEADEQHYEASRRFIERDGVGRMPVKPEADLDALCTQYPRAAAYLKAEAYSHASNHHKASAGHRAMDRLVAGDDVGQVMGDMENWLPDTAWTD